MQTKAISLTINHLSIKVALVFGLPGRRNSACHRKNGYDG
jgi:hypothetical protein